VELKLVKRRLSLMILAVCLACLLTAGCRGQALRVDSMEAPEAEGTQGLFLEWLRYGGLGQWHPELPPQVGEGIHGLTLLVNGAAEDLWSRGVRKAVFQGFREEGKSTVLEIQRYSFQSEGQAGVYFRTGCSSQPPDSTVRRSCFTTCLLPGDYLSQIMVHWGKDLFDVRYYGRRKEAGLMVQALEKGFVEIACPGG